MWASEPRPRTGEPAASGSNRARTRYPVSPRVQRTRRADAAVGQHGAYGWISPDQVYWPERVAFWWHAGAIRSRTARAVIGLPAGNEAGLGPAQLRLVACANLRKGASA